MIPQREFIHGYTLQLHLQFVRNAHIIYETSLLLKMLLLYKQDFPKHGIHFLVLFELRYAADSVFRIFRTACTKRHSYVLHAMSCTSDILSFL